MITLATTVNVRTAKSKGHIGERTNYVVSIENDAITFYPMAHAGYGSPSDCSDINVARIWANAIGHALDLDVVDHTGEPNGND